MAMFRRNASLTLSRMSASRNSVVFRPSPCFNRTQITPRTFTATLPSWRAFSVSTESNRPNIEEADVATENLSVTDTTADVTEVVEESPTVVADQADEDDRVETYEERVNRLQKQKDEMLARHQNSGTSSQNVKKVKFESKEIVEATERSSVDLTGIDQSWNLLEDVIQNDELSPQEREDMERVASYRNANAEEIQKRRVKFLVDKYGRKPGDTGSSEVQIAVLTDKINHLVNYHFVHHRRDIHSRRGLERLRNQRRKMLMYLKRTRFPAFARMLQDMNIHISELDHGKYVHHNEQPNPDKPTGNFKKKSRQLNRAKRIAAAEEIRRKLGKPSLLPKAERGSVAN